MIEEELTKTIIEKLKRCVKGFKEAEHNYMTTEAKNGKFITFEPNSTPNGDFIEVHLTNNIIFGYALADSIIRTDIYRLDNYNIESWAKNYAKALCSNISWEN